MYCAPMMRRRSVSSAPLPSASGAVGQLAMILSSDVSVTEGDGRPPGSSGQEAELRSLDALRFHGGPATLPDSVGLVLTSDSDSPGHIDLDRDVLVRRPRVGYPSPTNAHGEPGRAVGHHGEHWEALSVAVVPDHRVSPDLSPEGDDRLPAGGADRRARGDLEAGAGPRREQRELPVLSEEEGTLGDEGDLEREIRHPRLDDLRGAVQSDPSRQLDVAVVAGEVSPLAVPHQPSEVALLPIPDICIRAVDPAVEGERPPFPVAPAHEVAVSQAGHRVAAHSRAAVPPGDVRHEPPGLVVQRRLRRQAQPSSISLSELSGADVYHQIPPTAEASFCKSSDS